MLCVRLRIDPIAPLGGYWNDGTHSTHGYNSIVVGFILTTNELQCITLYEECIA